MEETKKNGRKSNSFLLYSSFFPYRYIWDKHDLFAFHISCLKRTTKEEEWREQTKKKRLSMQYFCSIASRFLARWARFCLFLSKIYEHFLRDM